jgi:hypothetical protein
MTKIDNIAVNSTVIVVATVVEKKLVQYNI